MITEAVYENTLEVIRAVAGSEDLNETDRQKLGEWVRDVEEYEAYHFPDPVIPEGLQAFWRWEDERQAGRNRTLEEEFFQQEPTVITEEQYERTLALFAKIRPGFVSYQGQQRLRRRIQEVEEYEEHCLGISPANYYSNILQLPPEPAVKVDEGMTLEEEFFSRRSENA